MFFAYTSKLYGKQISSLLISWWMLMTILTRIISKLAQACHKTYFVFKFSKHQSILKADQNFPKLKKTLEFIWYSIMSLNIFSHCRNLRYLKKIKNAISPILNSNVNTLAQYCKKLKTRSNMIHKKNYWSNS